MAQSSSRRPAIRAERKPIHVFPLVLAILLAAFGWRAAAAEPDIAAPPLSGPEATLSTPGSTPGLDPAARHALAAEAAVPTISRHLEVKRGDTLMALLTKSGIERRQAHAAITALSKVYNPRRLRPGQSIRLGLAAEDGSDGTRTEEEVRSGTDEKTDKLLRLVSLSLSTSPDEEVHVVRQANTADYLARAEARQLSRHTSLQSGVIESSLFTAARNAGMPSDVLIELIRLFSFDVDFQRDLQPGDRFEALYDSYYDRAGLLAKTGPLTYASMVLSGKRLEFYHFVAADGTDDHFNPKGQSVQRALLRTPVDGARISSGYGLRKHPIKGYTRMHRGVDFAAPRGTPIYAAGHGTIDRLGRRGGYGKYIRIRHTGTYKTAYAHLKSYARGLKRGKRVKQGQVIGYVGSTGNSTGPHLHYEVFFDGKQVNPRKIKLPSGKKLKGADLEAFRLARAQIDHLRGEAIGATLIADSGCRADWAGAPAAGQSETPSEPSGC